MNDSRRTHSRNHSRLGRCKALDAPRDVQTRSLRHHRRRNSILILNSGGRLQSRRDRGGTVDQRKSCRDGRYAAERESSRALVFSVNRWRRGRKSAGGETRRAQRRPGRWGSPRERRQGSCHRRRYGFRDWISHQRRPRRYGWSIARGGWRNGMRLLLREREGGRHR